MRRPTADLWWGIIVLLVLILLAGILLVRARSSDGSEQDQGRIVTIPGQRPGATPLDPGHRSMTWTRYSVAGDRLRVELATGHHAEVRLHSRLGGRPVYDACNGPAYPTIRIAGETAHDERPVPGQPPGAPGHAPPCGA